MQTLTKYCAWCGQYMSGNPRKVENVSHGMCRLCVVAFEADPLNFIPPSRLRTPGPACQMEEGDK